MSINKSRPVAPAVMSAAMVAPPKPMDPVEAAKMGTPDMEAPAPIALHPEPMPAPGKLPQRIFQPQVERTVRVTAAASVQIRGQTQKLAVGKLLRSSSYDLEGLAAQGLKFEDVTS